MCAQQTGVDSNPDTGRADHGIGRVKGFCGLTACSGTTRSCFMDNSEIGAYLEKFEFLQVHEVCSGYRNGNEKKRGKEHLNKGMLKS